MSIWLLVTLIIFCLFYVYTVFNKQNIRNFSHYSYDTYLSKAKEMVRYFSKLMEEVTTDEMRKFLMMLKEERNLANKTVNYYNSILRFMYEVTITWLKSKKMY